MFKMMNKKILILHFYAPIFCLSIFFPLLIGSISIFVAVTVPFLYRLVTDILT